MTAAEQELAQSMADDFKAAWAKQVAAGAVVVGMDLGTPLEDLIEPGCPACGRGFEASHSACARAVETGVD